MKSSRSLALSALFCIALAPAAPALAQHAGHDAHMGQGAPAAAPAGASTEAYQAANAKMHKDMDIAYSGDADVDFARGMIPHHQGAIDMARIQLQHGKDPELRKLAQEVISAQEKEIAFLNKWLAEHAKK